MQVIHIGAMSPKLSEQLKGRVSGTSAKRLDMLADAFVKLKVHGIVSGTESSKIMKRLMRAAEEAIKAKGSQP